MAKTHYQVSEMRGRTPEGRKAARGRVIYEGDSLAEAQKRVQRGIAYRVMGVQTNGMPGEFDIAVREGWRGLTTEFDMGGFVHLGRGAVEFIAEQAKLR